MSAQSPAGQSTPTHQVSGAEVQVQFLIEQIGNQAKQHAAQLSAIQVGHAIEMQALRAELAAAQQAEDGTDG